MQQTSVFYVEASLWLNSVMERIIHEHFVCAYWNIKTDFCKCLYFLFLSKVEKVETLLLLLLSKNVCVCVYKEDIRILLNPLKPKLVHIVLKNSAHTSKTTPHFTITAINLLTLFKKIIPVYSENRMKPTNTKCSVTDW
jgi:hypothetical protein